jgi:2-oxoglutarate dehydrogenase E2 component (dihydrolipoamide succinyltransferase)
MASINIVVPELSESVVEATVAEWLVSVGDAVNFGDVLVVLETDKVNLEVTAEQAGTITEITAEEEEDVTPGAVLAVMDASGASPVPQPAQSPEAQPVSSSPPVTDDNKATPVAQRVASANNVDLSRVSSSDGGKVVKADVEKFIANQVKPAASSVKPSQSSPFASLVDPSIGRREERVKLSRRRRTIATRLVEAQSTAAMLTTFNEVDMKPVMDIRKKHKESFREKYGVGLGFTSFFVKAVVGALKAFPNLNAEIDGKEVILKHYYDIGIAIGAEEGLVVPVIRDCDRLSFAGIEGNVKGYAVAASDGSLSLDDLRGGTFTITNGGVFGSMMSTPILNPPQVGILGLHGIKERAVVVDGEIVIRPMMYLALTYDHRIVDGRESVQFLVKVKELIEDPERLLIEG